MRSMSKGPTRMRGTPTIAIVGGGASGTLVAAHLLAEQHATPAAVVLVERAAEVGPGLAYAARSDRHLLNTPAGIMSAFPGDPGHFTRWLTAQGAAAEPEAFVPRHRYGEYLRSVLGQAIRDAPADRRLRRGRGQVVDIAPRADRRFELTCAAGDRVTADFVVLALGNFASPRPAAVDTSVVAGDRYIADPWAPGALDCVEHDDRIMLLGTGLTAVDTALALDDRGHHGPIFAVSRHGLLPAAHCEARSDPVTPDLAVLLAGGSGRQVYRAIRCQVAATAAEGGDWRSVVDGLRSHGDRLWAALPAPEQRRVLRHLGRYWAIHRHRMAPDVAGWIDGLVASGQLTVMAGRVQDCTLGRDGLSLTLTGRPTIDGSAPLPVHLQVDVLVNCTGPATDLAGVGDPLIDALGARGLVRPGRLGLGLAVTPEGAVVDRGGRSSGALWTIGPLRQGRVWETTATPEIRVQAAALASRLSTLMRVNDVSDPYAEAV